MTKDLSDKTWNNQQDKNEGFSGDNLPKDYNPSKEKRLQTERETDEDGNDKTVERARDTATGQGDNSAIRDNTENRDGNYDHSQRYKPSNPESHSDRGNMKLDE